MPTNLRKIVEQDHAWTKKGYRNAAVNVKPAYVKPMRAALKTAGIESKAVYTGNPKRKWDRYAYIKVLEKDHAKACAILEPLPRDDWDAMNLADGKDKYGR